MLKIQPLIHTLENHLCPHVEVRCDIASGVSAGHPAGSAVLGRAIGEIPEIAAGCLEIPL